MGALVLGRLVVLAQSTFSQTPYGGICTVRTESGVILLFPREMTEGLREKVVSEQHLGAEVEVQHSHLKGEENQRVLHCKGCLWAKMMKMRRMMTFQADLTSLNPRSVYCLSVLLTLGVLFALKYAAEFNFPD